LSKLRSEELSNPSKATAWVFCKLLELQTALESVIKLDDVDIFRDAILLKAESNRVWPWAILRTDLLEDLAPVAHKLGAVGDMESLVKSWLA
jgi:hypothetical protein